MLKFSHVALTGSVIPEVLDFKPYLYFIINWAGLEIGAIPKFIASSFKEYQFAKYVIRWSYLIHVVQCNLPVKVFVI